MKSPQIVPLLVLVVSVVGFVTVLVNPSTFWARDADRGLPAAAGPNADLLPRVGGLAEVEPPHGQRAPVTDGSVFSGQLVAVRDELLEASVGTRGRLGESPRAATLAELRDFREYVAGTISEMRKQEAAEQYRKLEERAARLDETMPPLEGWLELTPRQSDKLRSALLSRLDRESEYLRLWEKGADEEILDELKASDQEAHREELSVFLTKHQLETYLSREGSRAR